MSDMEHSDQPTPATPGSPPSTEATSPTEPALGTPTDPTSIHAGCASRGSSNGKRTS